ncbi:hypothetical protein [Rubripirellula reticaptiva]|uniref:Uncharacterized protein n=1 Tax=Rubripirellula reticaptiva TaxID=2528013 RepID=A0A5C6EH70_9BACT|nr:hypothetical protein [Rubripirellula reticaptiva]TWU47824.1 hypothetical protein Poly59_46660 [Rubripirellula reticaptiva]
MNEIQVRNRNRLKWLLRLVGVSGLFAFGAAVMPEKWMIEIAGELGIDPFPDSPLTFYLARNLSLMYGFVGVMFLLIARDLDRYFELVRVLTFCTVAFGTGQWIVNSMAGLPTWWVLGESLSTIGGGLLMAWFVRGSR